MYFPGQSLHVQAGHLHLQPDCNLSPVAEQAFLVIFQVCKAAEEGREWRHSVCSVLNIQALQDASVSLWGHTMMQLSSVRS